jgi:hypothetical protein
MADGLCHRSVVHDKPGFLLRLMDELAGDARISLEGDLSHCRFSDDLIVSHDETDVLRRNTRWPRQDFVVVRLTPASAVPIFKQVMSAGLKRAIIHVQIERNGVLELGAYDNFHTESVVTARRRHRARRRLKGRLRQLAATRWRRKRRQLKNPGIQESRKRKGRGNTRRRTEGRGSD